MSKYNYISKDFTYDGKRYKARGKTEEEAADNKREMIAELDKGKAAYSQRKDILFKAYVKKWNDTFNKTGEITTCKDIESRINNYILPYIGNFRMKDITRSDIVPIFDNMKGMSRSRISKVRQTLKRILNAAYDDGYLLKVPNIRRTDMPESKDDGTRRAITPFERALTVKVSEYHHAGSWVLMMLYCGLRPQETAALQGRHINLKTMLITIEQARKADGSIDTTKTMSGKRTVPIPPQLLPYLPKVEPFEFVFKSAKGKWLSHSNQQNMWDSFKREMNIAAGCKLYRNALVPPFPIADDLVPYCYRHTFCTDAVTAGVPIETLKELAGHKNISVTAKYYLHMNDERMAQAAKLLSDYHASKNLS